MAKSNIPEARTKLLDIAERLRMRGVHDLSAEVERVVYGLLFRNHPRKSVNMGHGSVRKKVREQVRRLAKTTDLTASEIGIRAGITEAMVISIINGEDE